MPNPQNPFGRFQSSNFVPPLWERIIFAFSKEPQKNVGPML